MPNKNDLVLYIIGGGYRLKNFLDLIIDHPSKIYVTLDPSKNNSGIELNLDSYKNINFTKKNIKNYDVLISCNNSKIISSHLIKKARIGSLNFHSGNLPNYRGGSPLQWQFLQNENRFGISIVELNNSLDSGRVFAEIFFNNDKNENFLFHQKKADKLFTKIFWEAVDNLLNNTPIKYISKDDGMIWIQRTELDSKLRFYNAKVKPFINHVKLLKKPYQYLYFYTEDNQKLEIKNAIPSKRTFKSNPFRLFWFGKKLFLQLSDGAVELIDYYASPNSKVKGSYIVFK